MEKNIIDLIVTDVSVNSIREKASSEHINLSELFKYSLEKWYSENESDLKQIKDASPLKKISFRVDEETERLYSLFVEQSISKLFNRQ